MLAKNANDYALCLTDRVVRTFFASKLAPTGGCGVWGLAGGYGLGRGIGEIEYFAALGRGELLGLAFEQERA